MAAVSAVLISELKANLFRYLREGRRGGEVQAPDQEKPVATTLAPAVKDNRDLQARLVSAGVIRPGTESATRILEKAPLALHSDLSEALAEDRADRL